MAIRGTCFPAGFTLEGRLKLIAIVPPLGEANADSPREGCCNHRLVRSYDYVTGMPLLGERAGCNHQLARDIRVRISRTAFQQKLHRGSNRRHHRSHDARGAVDSRRSLFTSRPSASRRSNQEARSENKLSQTSSQLGLRVLSRNRGKVQCDQLAGGLGFEPRLAESEVRCPTVRRSPSISQLYQRDHFCKVVGFLQSRWSFELASF